MQGLSRRSNPPPPPSIAGIRSPKSKSARLNPSLGSRGRRITSQNLFDRTKLKDESKLRPAEKIILNYLEDYSLGFGSTDDTAIFIVKEGGVLTYVMNLLTEELVEVESKSTEFIVSGMTERAVREINSSFSYCDTPII